MKLELKKLKVIKSMSEETTAYTAELWCDGRKAADMSNRGYGAADDVYWTDWGYQMKGEVDAYIASTMPPLILSNGTAITCDLEIWTSDEIARIEEEKWIKRVSKTKVVFTLAKDPPGSYRTVNTNDIDKASRFLSTKYGIGGFTIIRPK